MRRIALFGACTQRSIADSRLAQVMVILATEFGLLFTFNGHRAANSVRCIMAMAGQAFSRHDRNRRQVGALACWPASEFRNMRDVPGLWII
jgi:hypothetical protein